MASTLYQVGTYFFHEINTVPGWYLFLPWLQHCTRLVLISSMKTLYQVGTYFFHVKEEITTLVPGWYLFLPWLQHCTRLVLISSMASTLYQVGTYFIQGFNTDQVGTYFFHGFNTVPGWYLFLPWLQHCTRLVLISSMASTLYQVGTYFFQRWLQHCTRLVLISSMASTW